MVFYFIKVKILLVIGVVKEILHCVQNDKWRFVPFRAK